MSSILMAQVDRSQKPVESESPDIKFPKINKVTLDNGIELWTVERNNLPIIELFLSIRSGAGSDPKDKKGVATLTAFMLKQGTKNRDLFTIEEDLDFLGSNLSTSASDDFSAIYFKTLTKNLDATFEIMKDVLLNPTFPIEEIERRKKELLTTLLQQKDSPVVAANAIRNAAIYGMDHPYGVSATGSETSIPTLTQDDLISFYQSNYIPNNAVIFAVGDFKTQELKSKLNKLLSTWKKGKPVKQVIAPAKPTTGKTVLFYNKPGAAQSEIRVAFHGPDRNAQDYYSTLVLNRILGEGFNSRINMNLRESKGYTYGARSGITYQWNGSGYFSSSGGFRSDVTDSSLIEHFYEFNRIAKEPVEQSEINFAVESIIKSMPTQINTNGQILSRIIEIYNYELPDNHLDLLDDYLNKLTIDDISKAAKKHISVGNYVVVVAGDLTSTLEKVKALNLGKIFEVDNKGNILREL